MALPSTLNLAYENDHEEDIQDFIQNSRSLKEKIYEKLSKKGKVKNKMINETTFGPKPKQNQENLPKTNCSKKTSCHSTKKLNNREATRKSLGKSWADWNMETKQI